MKLDFTKKEKGSYGYLNYRKTVALFIMLSVFLVVAAVFVAGLLYFKTKNNIMTVMAILLVLPGAKFAVSFFVLAPHKSCSEQQKLRAEELLSKYNCSNSFLFDLVVSNSKKPYGIQLALVTDNAVYAFSEEKSIDKKIFETSVKEFLKNEKLNVNVFLYSDADKFFSKLGDVFACERQKDSEYKAAANLRAFKLMCM